MASLWCVPSPILCEGIKLLKCKNFPFVHCSIYRDYFMVGERVRFLFTSCGESQMNERVFE